MSERPQKVAHLSLLKRQQRVLVVDDSINGRQTINDAVNKFDPSIAVSTFTCAEHALDWLEHNRVDLVIIESSLPQLDGVAFTRRLRANHQLNAVPILLITDDAQKQQRLDGLEAGATGFLSRPVDARECLVNCRNLLKMRGNQANLEEHADWLAGQVELTTQQVVAREREALLRLGLAGEYRDAETGYHVLRTARYARLIAEAMGLDEMFCEDIEYAVPMHDIGKIGIPDDVLTKPGRLNDEEWLIMRQHTVIGHQILSDSQSRFIQLGAVIALNHHEKFDGTGYPSGIAGEEIPLAARIVAVADVFDALMSPRSYKRPWQMDMALLYIREQAGSHFDPDCVDGFFNCLDRIKQVLHEFEDY